MGPLTAADELLDPEELWCCACGRKTAATLDEVAQAKRADAAWEVEQDRIMRRPGQSDAQDGSLSTQDIRAAAATIAADSVKPDADGMVSTPVVCPVCAEMDGWGCPEHRAAPLPGATP